MEKEVNVGKIAIWLVVILLAVFLVVKFSDVSGSAVQSNQIRCTDSDGGRNYNVVSDTEGISSGVYPLVSKGMRLQGREGCFDESLLYEYYCKDNLMYVEPYKCPNGCKDGACVGGNIKEEGCIDSDGGRNYNVKGTTIDYSGYSNTDYCLDDGIQLKEFFCSDRDNTVDPTIVNCKDGCRNGICVGGTVTEEPNIAEEPWEEGETAKQILQELNNVIDGVRDLFNDQRVFYSKYSTNVNVRGGPLNCLDLCRQNGYNVCLYALETTTYSSGTGFTKGEQDVLGVSCNKQFSPSSALAEYSYSCSCGTFFTMK